MPTRAKNGIHGGMARQKSLRETDLIFGEVAERLKATALHGAVMRETASEVQILSRIPTYRPFRAPARRFPEDRRPPPGKKGARIAVGRLSIQQR